MIELEPLRIGEQRLEVGRRIIAAALESDEVLVALSIGQLHHAEPIPAGDQAHCLGIDGNRSIRKPQVRGQVFLMEMNRHSHS